VGAEPWASCELANIRSPFSSVQDANPPLGQGFITRKQRLCASNEADAIDGVELGL